MFIIFDTGNKDHSNKQTNLRGKLIKFVHGCPVCLVLNVTVCPHLFQRKKKEIIHSNILLNSFSF